MSIYSRLVGGYVRMSKVQFPPDCITIDQRKAFVDEMTVIRKTEILADARRDGVVIDVWYVDMGISGRGQFLSQRVEFDLARRDAAAGKLKSLYARDLSRLFRNQQQQECWFEEMETAGCEPKVQDLPFVIDPATRKLIRQQIGSINEYMVERNAAVVRAVNESRVASGVWVGRSRSMWGLRYVKELKGFEFDAATADKVRYLFETYLECAAIADHTAARMNSNWEQRLPRATRTPTGRRWNGSTVLSIVENCIYERWTEWGAVRTYVPHLIPEVVSPELLFRVKEARRLAGPAHIGITEKADNSRMVFTFSGLIRCAVCGGRIGANPYDRNFRYTATRRRDDSLPDGITRISWKCYRPKNRETRCPCWQTHQYRIEALLIEATDRALTLVGQNIDRYEQAHETIRAYQLRIDLINSRLARLQEAEARYLRLHADGTIQSEALLRDCLGELALERNRIASGLHLMPAELQIPIPVVSKAFIAEQRHRLTETFRRKPINPIEIYNEGKRALLDDLGTSVVLSILPGSSFSENPIHSRGGRTLLSVSFAALGLTGSNAIQVVEASESDPWSPSRRFDKGKEYCCRKWVLVPAPEGAPPPGKCPYCKVSDEYGSGCRLCESCRRSYVAVEGAIAEFCSGDFKTTREVQEHIGIGRQPLGKYYVIPMVRSGRLRLRYPEYLKDHRQAYITASPAAGAAS